MFSDALANEDLSSKDMIILLHEDQNEKVVESNEEEEHDTIHNHCTISNDTGLISEVPNTAENENLILAPGQGKTQFQFLMTSFAKSCHLRTYFQMVNLGIKLNVI